MVLKFQCITWKTVKTGWRIVYGNLAQTKVTRKEGNSIKKLPLLDWTVGKPTDIFLNYCLMRGEPIPLWVVPSVREQAEQAMGNKVVSNISP